MLQKKRYKAYDAKSPSEDSAGKQFLIPTPVADIVFMQKYITLVMTLSTLRETRLRNIIIQYLIKQKLKAHKLFDKHRGVRRFSTK